MHAVLRRLAPAVTSAGRATVASPAAPSAAAK